MIIDELSVNNDDKKKMAAGETGEFEETLAWLRRNTAMTLAALSSTSVLDKHSPIDRAVTQKVFYEMVARTGFKTVSLKHIMRSSQNIATATSTASISAAWTVSQIKDTIKPGYSSTVPGTRPKAMVYKHSNKVDYKKLAGFVMQHLRTLDTEHLKCVLLTDQGISAMMLSDQMRRGNVPVSCYHGGVDKFDHDGTPKYRKGSAGGGGEAELTAWLRAEGGVLVTHEVQFRGAEVDYVIVVKKQWAGSRNSSRNPLTRAVAGLLLLISDSLLNVQALREHWDVEIVEEGVKGIGSIGMWR